MSGAVTLEELPLERVAPGGDLRDGFLVVQRPWAERGVERWVDLVRPDGPWPVVVFGALREAEPALLGTIVGVWAPEPLERFDDLLESACPDGSRGDDRPLGGVWHFVAVTRRPEARGLNVGRTLVRTALGWLARERPGARARTLSPAVGLPDLAAIVAGGDKPTEASCRAALRSAADERGRPVLPILRLHLGAGAWLDAVLLDSRRDDADSGRVTLRFGYETDPAARELRAINYRAWVADRRSAIESGRAEAVQERPGLWLVADCGDDRVMSLPLLHARNRDSKGAGGS